MAADTVLTKRKKMKNKEEIALSWTIVIIVGLIATALWPPTAICLITIWAIYTLIKNKGLR